MSKKRLSLPRGFRRRALQTGSALAKHSVKAGLRRVGVGADDDQVYEAAEQLLDLLGNQKGLPQKVGQLLSYISGVVDPRIQEKLQALQAGTEPLPWAEIRPFVEEQLKGDVADLFDGIETTPFAAASIGQVHRAQYEGRTVAVKVQYPGIEDTIAEDLRFVGPALRTLLLPSAASGRAVLAELGDRVREECDYQVEAANQQLYQRIVEPFPGCEVPEIVAARSSRRVLTTVFDPGASFQAFLALASPEERNLAGARIFEVCFQSLFRHCIYNADPHPGNYLFGSNGEVTFLDFGCVRGFEPKLIEAWKANARAIMEGDKEGFRTSWMDLGLAKNEQRFDWNYQWEVMVYLYEPVLSTTPYTYTREHVERSYSRMIAKNPNKFRTSMPPEYLFINRLQWGLNSVLADLQATGDWRSLWLQAIESPTTPIKG